MNRRLVGWIALLCFSLVGCGSKAQISGNVSLNGTTVSNGEIVFYPVKGEPKSCPIQADGSYKIEGVAVGDCVVTVVQNADGVSAADALADDKKKAEAQPGTKMEARSLPTPKNGLPSKYVDTATSPLKFTIKRGKNTIDLILEE